MPGIRFRGAHGAAHLATGAPFRDALSGGPAAQILSWGLVAGAWWLYCYFCSSIWGALRLTGAADFANQSPSEYSSGIREVPRDIASAVSGGPRMLRRDCFPLGLLREDRSSGSKKHEAL